VDVADKLRYHLAMQSAYLTVPQAAAELSMSPDGVYKLIKRGKLPAIRRSERGMRISRVALAAYIRRLQRGEAAAAPAPEARVDVDQLLAEFERKTGLSPREWERRREAREIEDSAENMRLTIRALGLLAAEKQQRTGRTDSGRELRRRPAVSSR
jgi:excisionase family DNA binding protein